MLFDESLNFLEACNNAFLARGTPAFFFGLSKFVYRVF